MDADEAVSLLPLVEGGDVGKADDGLARGELGRGGLGRGGLSSAALGRCGLSRGGLRRLGLRRACRFQSLQKPHGSVAAAGTEHGADGRIGESAIQFREPALIVARQVPVAPENSRVVLNAVAGGNNGEPRVE
jgi:hypothetical protein